MSLKSWVLDRMHRVNGIVARPDLPPREPALEATTRPSPLAAALRSDAAPRFNASEPSLAAPEHLGAYAPLIASIRDELEHFVASQVRLHLAIAERDRFLLTSIEVDCPSAGETRRLLQRFMHEFRPEQVKRYLVREVIGALPNAAAIDLSQFAGLADAQARAEADEGGEYRELLAELGTTPVTTLRPYQVNLRGRWAEADAARPASTGVRPTPSTPLAGQRREFDVEDADGRRRVVLQSVVPGRRYRVGKGEDCDIRVNGTYASRRHAEIWLEGGAWWAIDAGSTNGVRIESAAEPQAASTTSATTAAAEPVRLAEGTRLVLSARADGSAADYPWIALRSERGEPTRATPIAATGAAAGNVSPKTPLTAILPASGATVLKLTAMQATGMRTLELVPSLLPVRVGRSRNQTLMIDRRHEGVSGHHLDIVELDDSGADVVVHGDNGVLVEGVPHATGARLRWKTGEAMVLGASADDHPVCTLLLARKEAR